jgi:hypothetical protein
MDVLLTEIVVLRISLRCLPLPFNYPPQYPDKSSVPAFAHYLEGDYLSRLLDWLARRRCPHRLLKPHSSDATIIRQISLCYGLYLLFLNGCRTPKHPCII